MTGSTPLDRLRSVMARLRDPQHGCPWDVKQTFATIAPYTIEEAYEVADAIERADLDALRDELGDLLLQVVFHARMAEEAGVFDLDDVANAIVGKMIRRHPHVFGDARVDSAEAQTVAWEEHKAIERAAAAQDSIESPSALDGVAVGLPALTRADKLQRRAARVGFDWPSAAPVLEKVAEELGEISAEIDAGSDHARLQDEVGDLLFAAVNLARHLKIDPEAALRTANSKFDHRFRSMEAQLRARSAQPMELDPDQWDALWRLAKSAAADGPTASVVRKKVD